MAHAGTRGTPKQVKPFHRAVHKRMPEVERELLVSQVEIMTPPCTDFGQARECLSGLRNGLAEIGREHGILVFGGGSHPTARWRQQQRTSKARYDELADDMQMLVRRDVVCGMHVHVEVPDTNRRVDLMNRLLPYTPMFLALSASSPFWQGRDTGLNAYRLSVWGEMPRTGLPELFADAADYDRFVAAMVRSGAIGDASFLWWTLRPSTRFPTLELRVADSCTRLEDTLSIAALYRCLVRYVDPLTDADRAARFAAIHEPYQRAISEELDRRRRAGRETIMVSLHSFTPAMRGGGADRPWRIGVLHHLGDTSFALRLLDVLREEGDLLVGDNQPYKMDGVGYTIPRHAYRHGIRYAEFEIRQDLLLEPVDQEAWGGRLATALQTTLELIPKP